MLKKENQIDEEGILREGEIHDDEIPNSDEKDVIVPKTQSPKGEDKDEVLNPDEDTIPFHKHPRWIAKQQEIDELKQQITDLEEITKNPKKEETPPSPDMPQEFIDLFGPNPEIWDKWQKLTARQREDLEKEIIEKIKNEDKEQAEAIEKGKQYVESSIKALEDAGQKFDRNELIKFMIDFEQQFAPIVNSEGNYDFAKGLELMQKMNADKKPSDIEEKKKIATITTDKKSGGDETPNKPVNTRDLRNKSFLTLGLEE